jgi:hypothetical protein
MVATGHAEELCLAMKTVDIAAAQTAEFREDTKGHWMRGNVAARAETEGVALLCFAEGFLHSAARATRIVGLRYYLPPDTRPSSRIDSHVAPYEAMLPHTRCHARAWCAYVLEEP